MIYKIMHTVCVTEMKPKANSGVSEVMVTLAELNGAMYEGYDDIHDVVGIITHDLEKALKKYSKYHIIRDIVMGEIFINISFSDDFEAKILDHSSFRVMYTVKVFDDKDSADEAVVGEPCMKFMECSKRSRK